MTASPRAANLVRILGNSSADLDSVMCSIAAAKLLRAASPHTPESATEALVAVASLEELRFRPQVTGCAHHLGLDLFGGSLIRPAADAAPGLTLLVDHNDTLPAQLAVGSAVVGALDHHAPALHTAVRWGDDDDDGSSPVVSNTQRALQSIASACGADVGGQVATRLVDDGGDGGSGADATPCVADAARVVWVRDGVGSAATVVTLWAAALLRTAREGEGPQAANIEQAFREVAPLLLPCIVNDTRGFHTDLAGRRWLEVDRIAARACAEAVLRGDGTAAYLGVVADEEARQESTAVSLDVLAGAACGDGAVLAQLSALAPRLSTFFGDVNRVLERLKFDDGLNFAMGVDNLVRSDLKVLAYRDRQVAFASMAVHLDAAVEHYGVGEFARALRAIRFSADGPFGLVVVTTAKPCADAPSGMRKLCGVFCQEGVVGLSAKLRAAIGAHVKLDGVSEGAASVAGDADIYFWFGEQVNTVASRKTIEPIVKRVVLEHDGV